MRPSDVARVVESLLPTGVAVYIEGPPGVGKTSVVRQAADKMGLTTLEVRPVYWDPVDFRGVPAVEKGRTIWATPQLWPSDPESKGVVFIDELPQAERAVQAACFQITLDKRIGDHQLPPGWAVVAAGNRQEDRAGAFKLLSALRSRVIKLTMEPSLDDFQTWALTHGVIPEVRGFLNFRPGLLFNFEPARDEQYCCPRTWEMVSKVVPSTPEDLLHPVAAGCVGEGPAAEFVAFARVYRDLPDVDKVLANPQAATVPSDPAILYALSGAIVERCRKADAKLLDNAIKYAGRMQTEFGVLTIRDAAAVNNKILNQPAASDWLRKNRHLLTRDGN